MIRAFLAMVMLMCAFGEPYGAATAAPAVGSAVDRHAVITAAEALLRKFWPTLQQDRSSYDLSASDTLETLSFGTPEELHGIRDESIRGYQAGQPIAKIIEPTGHWFVPLVARGSYRAMIEVLDQGQGRWQGFGIGWAPLAKKWQAVIRRWPNTEQGGPMLLIAFSQGYYVSITSVPYPNLTSLERLTLDANSKVPDDFRLDEASRTLDSLKMAIETQPGQ